MTVSNHLIIQQVLLKRGNTAVASAYTGPIGEVVVDSDLMSLRVQDAATPGGWLMASQAQVAGITANIPALVTTLISNVAPATNQLTNGSAQLYLDSDGNITLPNASTITNTNVGWTLTAALNATGDTSVQTNSLFVLITDPQKVADITAAPTNFHIDFNGGPTNATITSITALGSGVYTLTGTWPENATGFPIVITSDNFVANVTGISSSAGLVFNTSGGSWVFGADGALTFPSTTRGTSAGINVNSTDMTVATTTGNIAIFPGSSVYPGDSRWVFNTDGGLEVPTNGTISYTPSTPGSWNSTPPTTVQEALDRIAALLVVLHSPGA